MSGYKKPTQAIYLDHAAATPLSLRAKAAMERAECFYGNPSSLHATGRDAKRILERARGAVARVLGASSDEIVFTGSGSEADALAILGAARARRHLGNHVLISAIEHKAVLGAASALAAEGFEVEKIFPARDGRISPDDVSAALRDDTVLVSVMYANNEIGTVQPLEEISRAIRARRAGKLFPLFHTDACQAPGMLPLRAAELVVDLMTINGSKIYGPKGIGALYVKEGVRLSPLVQGGGQEGGRRGGTESVALAAGFAAALLEAEMMREGESARLKKLQLFFFSELRAHIPQCIVNGSKEKRIPNNIHVSIPGVEGESLLLMLDEEGIACATGSACNALDLEPSHVLLAIGQPPELAHGSLRFSMGRGTTPEEISRTVQVLAEAARALRGISSLHAYA